MRVAPPLTQPGACSVRHVTPTDPGGGQATAVLGRSFYPVWDGLRSERGFQSGQYELRMNEEGGFTLVVPNTEGGDGKLHRGRFEILRRGRVVALTNDVATYRGGSYRPGDEWIEVYSGGRNTRPDYVGTPLEAKVTAKSIEITGVDPYWLTKKSRELAAGFWCHAPRDVYEHYTQLWQVAVKDDFADGSQFAYSDAVQTTANGAWRYLRGVPNAGRVRLGYQGPSTADKTTAIQATATVPLGTGSSEPRTAWRYEVRFAAGSTLRNEDVVYVGVAAVDGTLVLTNPTLMVALYGLVSGAPNVSMMVDTLTGNRVIRSQVPQGIVAAGAGFDIAIEGRDRWAFVYVNGRLVGVVPTLIGGNAMAPYVKTLVTWSNGVPSNRFIDVEHAILRRTRPFLMRGSTKGDYVLPGTLPPGGLRAAYYIDDKQLADSNSGILPSNWELQLLDPTRAPSARRQDAAINFGAGGAVPAWQPGGDGTYFSARWYGAIYLDLANRDYRLWTAADDRARVWVGKTRFGEQVIDDWSSAGHPMTRTGSVWLKAGNSGASPSGSSGPLAGLASGWYPIVVEYSQVTGGGGCILEYERSDQLGLKVIAGSGSYPHLIRATPNLVAYWRLGDGTGNNSTARDHGGLGLDGTYGSAALGDTGYPSLIRSALAHDVNPVANGGITIPNNAALNFTGGVTCEAWINPDSVAAGAFDIFRKDLQWGFQRNASQVLFFVYFGSGAFNFTSVASAVSSLAAGNWYHVVGTFDGTNLRLYLNGVLVAGPTALGAPGTMYVAGGSAVGLGGPPAGSGAFDGKLSECAVYSRALTAAEVTAHYNAGYVDPASDAGSQLSPYGIYADQVRYDSHYDVLQAIARDFGYQFRSEARQLESGLFPAEMVPRVRLGRDSEKVLDAVEAASMQSTISAAETADAILSDAQGLADQAGASQLSAEVFNFAEIDQHLFLVEEYDSQGDISDQALLLQRLASMLTLRGGTWESVEAQPRGHRELLDSLPLAGALAEFFWTPGDSVRLDFAVLGIQDSSPRAILGVQRPFRPAGLGPPTVSFKARNRGNPRTLADVKRAMREAIRQQLRESRNYQGQKAVYQGSMGSENGAGAPVAAISTDINSRLALPVDVSRIARLTLVVQEKSDASAKTISVNGTSTGKTFTKPDRYDLSPFVARYLGSSNLVFAAASGGTGTSTYSLEAELVF